MDGRAALVAAVACLVVAEAGAQVLYKLIARDGKVTYSDHAPKNFDGQVVRIETDTASNVLPSRPAAAAPASPATSVANQRAANRESLEKALRAAQAKVDAARKAKAEGGEPGSDEMQVIQKRYAPLKAGQDPPRANCRNALDAAGKPYLLCAAQVPGEAYYDRQKRLDGELEQALAELEQAERAYRRGTD